MKILCVGDIHCKLTNFQNIDLLEKKIIEIINLNQIELIVLLGDLLHTHEKLHILELNKILNFIRNLSLKCKTYILVGNHDMINNQEYLSSNNWMEMFNIFNIPNVKIANRVLTFDKLIFVPYVSKGNFIKTLDENVSEWKDFKIIFGHQEISGENKNVQYKKNVLTEQNEIEKWNKDFPLLISGHIHLKQKLQDNLIYTGIPFCHNFGDDVENSLFEIDSDTLEINEIKLNFPFKKNVYFSLKEIDSLLNFFEDFQNDGNQYKIHLSGSLEEINNFRHTHKDKLLISNFKFVFKQIFDKIQIKKEEKIHFFEYLGKLIIEKKSESLNEIFQNLLENKI